MMRRASLRMIVCLTLSTAARVSAQPLVTVNGSASPITVTGGTNVTVAVANGPGGVTDRISLAAVGAPATTYLTGGT